MAQAEQALDAVPVPDQGVEGGQQDGSGPVPARRATRARRGRRRRAAAHPSTATGTRAVSTAAHGGPAAASSPWYTARSASVATPSERPAAATSRVARIARRIHSCARQLGRDGALGQVVDALEAAPLAADELADVEQPLGRDLGLGPVPPGPTLLGPTELVGGERTLGAQTVQHVGATLVVVLEHVPALAPGPPGPPRRRRRPASPRAVARTPRGTSTRTWSSRSPSTPRSTRSRPTAPRRAYATSSCDRASTEIVSSCTAPRRRSIAGHAAARPGRRAGLGAKRAIRRASSMLSESRVPDGAGIK